VTEEQLRIVVADDQALVRAGFRSILDKQPGLSVVGEAGDGREAIRLADELRPDLVLMDIRMPGLDGLSATRELMRRESPPIVVILTTFDADEYVYTALRDGASGFLLKDTSPEELADAVRSAVSGSAMLSPGVTRRLIEAYVSRPDPHERNNALAGVSPRELDVLRLVAAGMSNAEIASELYLAETTVKSHVARLLQKLGLRDRVQAVVLAYERGVVAPGESERLGTLGGH
jgi:DNA-binding NarL/FixJ family response regulator